MSDPEIVNDESVRDADKVTADDSLATAPRLLIRITRNGESVLLEPIPAQNRLTAPADWTGREATNVWRQWAEHFAEYCDRINTLPWMFLSRTGSRQLYIPENYNCMGLASGRFNVEHPSSTIFGTAGELLYLKSKGFPVDALPAGEITDTAHRIATESGDDPKRVGPDAYMREHFGAWPVSREQDARYALYGGHIALRLGRPLNLWLSKYGNVSPLFLHSTAPQIAGKDMGAFLFCYGTDRPTPHVEVVEAP